MAAYGVERSFTFPLNDPDRFPAYRVPNDRVLEWAAASDGALVPFCRLDLTDGADPRGGALPRPGRARHQAAPPGAEVRLRRARARPGVPARRRAARADPDPRRPRPAGDRRRPAATLSSTTPRRSSSSPMPRSPTSSTSAARCSTTPTSSTTRRSGRTPTCARCLPPPRRSRSLFASDAPYGMRGDRPAFSSGRALRRAGATRRPAAGDVLGERRARRAAASRRRRCSPPLVARDRTVPLQRLRVHDYLIMATTLLWTRLPDMPGAIGLALRACDTNGNGELARSSRACSTWPRSCGRRRSPSRTPTRPRAYSRAAGAHCSRSRTRSSSTCDRSGRACRGARAAGSAASSSCTPSRAADAGARSSRPSPAPGSTTGSSSWARTRARSSRTSSCTAPAPSCATRGATARRRRSTPGSPRSRSTRTGRSSCWATARRSTARRSHAWRRPRRGTRVLAADYGAGRSHPVVIPRALWDEIPWHGETPVRPLGADLSTAAICARRETSTTPSS